MKNTEWPVPRWLARQYGNEAYEIGEQGYYITPSGNRVEIREALDHAIADTASYQPGRVPALPETRYDTGIEVVNETTLSGAKRLLDDGYNPVVLNFAAATHPGGGFLEGARAQEEYLAWSSGLYFCLRDQPMYAYNREHRNPFSSDYALYSPRVPVFRSDDGDLLETPYPMSIITCPAVNAHHFTPEQYQRVPEVMGPRIDKVLTIGAAHNHDAIVLGAWGCGAFRLDPTEIARLFHCSLAGPYAGGYRRVVFSIVDKHDDLHTITPFVRAFAGG